MDSMSRSTPVPPCYDDDGTQEESSWTMYFNDFSNGNEYDDVAEMNGNRSCCSSDINRQTPPLVSLEHNKSIKKNRLSFKKRKTNGSSACFVDEDLEDTACSPINSPKMCDMENQFGKIMKMKDAMYISKEDKESGPTRERDESSSINGGENEETQLKKRGLCLVPLSMVVQYVG
ncbi:hypothetical protein F3Y22_tig00111342pilonHSYRG00022 [Hibiscus syriacus]|uniref:Uncharacterized protein n=1 Tax=Hibiscus syriacus TaxID=106335 RepID=A0A6A2YNY9_HIBSY|nr:vascular-related unknown protein 4-like [Hibiscus syriacus]KAE8681033.1 hypothetical protein F3Y22_tig00111342pilonHSYRG00022 [Hibiscus syriacus]